MNSKQTSNIFIIVFVLVVIATVIGAFMLIESPSEARAKKRDQARIDDLRDIKYGLEDYARDYNAVPESLDVLEEENTYRSYDFNDPYTDEPYEYTIEDNEKGNVQLCAVFQSETEIENNRYIYGYYSEEWSHPEGRHCFDIRLPLREITTSEEEFIR